MPWKLTISITDGNQRGEKYDFLKDSILIGRSKRADLMLNDASASAEHSRILIREDVVEVEDLGSKNGTFLNSLPIQRSTIKTGDRIQIGRSELEIRLEPLTEKNRLASAIYQSALIAGYEEEERNFMADSMIENLVAAHSFAFSNGEELLIETISWFEQVRSPDLIILDFKMPIINGINTAISLRAYERAFQRDSLVPVLFFCDPPDSEAFRKVLTFCSPAMLFPRQEATAEFESQAQLMIKNLRRAPVG
jgi:pSer/pThr/pTyr-binding forkhead associated (FHA) protein